VKFVVHCNIVYALFMAIRAGSAKAKCYLFFIFALYQALMYKSMLIVIAKWHDNGLSSGDMGLYL
jgi:hypothetical protein